MFKGIRDMMSMMKNVGQISAQMKDLEAQLRVQTATGQAGGGMVTVTVNGLLEVQSVSIEPAIFEQENAREFIQGLVVSATNMAIVEAKALHAKQLQGITGGMDLSNMGAMFGDMEGMSDTIETPEPPSDDSDQAT